jgi:diaminopimelate epimerase
MNRLYDARGNLYRVVSPDVARHAGVAVPATAAQAGAEAPAWTAAAIDAFCRSPDQAGKAKPFISDGLLVGPFEASAPFNLLIVNTDGGLAERSGNGLTIFTTALKDEGLTPPGPFDLHVHHGAGATTTTVELSAVDGTPGVWVSMGEPGYGPDAVGARVDASRETHFNRVTCSHVPALAALDARWSASQFVRVGNPHCVTLLNDAQTLPSWEDLHDPALLAALTAIADPAGDGRPGGLVCPAGVNLQWAARIGPNRLAARVFERGEGPTRSSGTSAVAVAAAALRLKLVEGPRIEVVMPGGTAPVIGAIGPDGGLNMMLFGVADLLS